MTKNDLELIDRARHSNWENILFDDLIAKCDSTEAMDEIEHIMWKQYKRQND